MRSLLALLSLAAVVGACTGAEKSEPARPQTESADAAALADTATITGDTVLTRDTAQRPP